MFRLGLSLGLSVRDYVVRLIDSVVLRREVRRALKTDHCPLSGRSHDADDGGDGRRV